MLEAKKTIIVIDDDRSILRVFTRVLERKGYEVTVAETGKDAIKELENRTFDAALIDVRLPDISGIDLLPKIQQMSPQTIKIVFTGSMDGASLAKNAYDLMDAFLIKPVKPEVLLSLLEEKINNR